MKFVIQRVTSASVRVEGRVVGEIGDGLFVLIGVADSDTKEIADRMMEKMLKLRIFEDEKGKTNRSIEQVGKWENGNWQEKPGSLLLVSQFTLYADCRHGNRPSFTSAGAPDFARKMYQYLIGKSRELLGDSSPVDEGGNSRRVQTGIFGADMKCSIQNDGPFTILLDSDELGMRRQNLE